MNNYLAMNICEAIMLIKYDSVTSNGNVYNNVEVNAFDTKGVYFSNDKYELYVAYDKIVEIDVRMKLINNIDYEDIYDNINDYEYPYNHINKGEL